tara:strand:- start:443 stop:2665 length:2223 start_codon:yes stop_codon:yes gene_type:complete
MGGAKTLSIIVAANIKGLETSMKQANKSIGSFASNAARLGSMLTFGVTAPLVAMGRTALNTFAEFEDGMMKVKAVTGATDREFKMLTDNAKKLGATTRFTSQQFADLQLVLGRKGFDPSAIKNMTSSIAKLALATGSDLGLAAEVVASSINAFNLESTEASSVANTLASAAANSSIELNTFATAFGHAGTAANAVGVDIEELSAMMGVLMDNGIKASKAGTGLRTAFSRLNEEGVPFGQTLDDLATGTMSLNDATKLVGRTGANQLLILASQREEINTLTDSYKTNTTELDRMSSMMGQTTSNKIAIMNSAINAMNLEFGALIAESIVPVMNAITSLSEKFGNLSNSTKKIIIGFGSLASVVGPLLLTMALFSAAIKTISLNFTAMWITASTKLIPALIGFHAQLMFIIAEGFAVNGVLGSITFSMNALTAAMLRNPVTAIATGLTIAAAAAYTFLVATDDTTESVDKLTKSFAIAGPKTKEYLDNFSGVFKSNQNPIKQATKSLKELDEILEKASPSKEQISHFTELFNDVDWDNVGSLGLNNFEEGLTDIPEQFEDTVDDIDFQAVRLTLMFDKLKNNLVSFGVTMAQGFSQGFAELFLRVTDSEGAIVSFGEKFNNFAKQFLAQIGVMIIQAAVFAALLSVIFPGQAISGASFMGNFSNLLAGGSGIKGFANGGRPPLNKMSLVGENGPELFNPGSQSGTIIPNHALGGGSVIPDVRISGNDLLIVFNKAQRRKNLR